MAVDNRYSNFVQGAKIIFPLVALALLSTMFLLSRTLDPSQAVTMAPEDVEKIATDQIVSAPQFSGVSNDGSEITIRAKSAQPDAGNSDRITAKTIEATIQTIDEISYVLHADEAIFDGNAQTLEATGMVMLETSAGYVMQTAKITANLAQIEVIAPGKVTGKGPSGTIEAGQMEVRTIENAQVIVFKNDVKLVYSP